MTDEWPEPEIVAESDQLDERIADFPLDRPRWLVVDLSFILLALMITAATIVMYLKLNAITTSTNDAVKHEIPGLQQQLSDEHYKRLQAEDVNQQAVQAILKLAKQVKDLGGEPGEIVLEPHVPPPASAPPIP